MRDKFTMKELVLAERAGFKTNDSRLTIHSNKDLIKNSLTLTKQKNRYYFSYLAGGEEISEGFDTMLELLSYAAKQEQYIQEDLDNPEPW